jgi:DNA polymerase III delta prime subunit
MNLDQIAGHRRVRAFLGGVVADPSRVSHAYLFTGPASVGKTTTALAFAADLLEVAGAAPTPSGLHPDLWVEDSEAEGLGIDVIRREGRTGRSSEAVDNGKPGVPAQPLQAFLSLKGLRSNRRVAVLARAERLKETAASPLLKTVEEPPEGAVLVLCSEAADLLPATIRSRCQEVEFARLDDDEIGGFLAARGLELDARGLRLARGAPGDALRLAGDIGEQERRLAWGTALEGLPGGSWLDIVGLGARFGTPDSQKNRVLAREALDAWEWWLRDVAAGRATEGGSAEPRAWDGVGLGDVLDLWESAREAADRVENNVNPRLAIEVFLADVAEVSSAAKLGPTRRVVSRGTLARVLAPRAMQR